MTVELVVAVMGPTAILHEQVTSVFRIPPPKRLDLPQDLALVLVSDLLRPQPVQPTPPVGTHTTAAEPVTEHFCWSDSREHTKPLSTECFNCTAVGLLCIFAVLMC